MKRFSLCSAALLATLLAASAPANAQDAEALPEDPPPVKHAAKPAAKTSNWYGYQTLFGVIASDIIMFVAIPNSGSNVGMTFAWIGAAGHVLTPPVVHWSHGYLTKGFASLGLTVGVPVVLGGLGFAIGYGIEQTPSGHSGVGLPIFLGAFGGLMLGGVAGTVVDVAVLAREEPLIERTKKTEARGLPPVSVAVVPNVDKERIGLSLVGRF